MKEIKLYIITISALLLLGSCDSEKLPELAVSPAIISVDAEGGEIPIKIIGNVSWQAQVDSEASFWCELSDASGTGNGNIKVQIKANTTLDERIANVIISGTGLKNRKVKITQEPYAPLLIDPATIWAESSEGNYMVYVTSKLAWTANVNTEAMTWCTLQNSSSTGDGVIEVHVDANPLNEERVATISVNTQDYTKQVIVQQAALGAGNIEVIASDDFEDDEHEISFDQPEYAHQAPLNNALGGNQDYRWKPWTSTWDGGHIAKGKSARSGIQCMQIHKDGLLLLDGFTIDPTKIYQLEVDIHPGGGVSTDGWEDWAGIDLYTLKQPQHEWSEPAIRIRINNSIEGKAPFQINGDFFTYDNRTFNSSKIFDFNSNKQKYTMNDAVSNDPEYWVPLKIVFSGEGSTENPIIIDYYLNNELVNTSSYKNIVWKNDWQIGIRAAGGSVAPSYFDNFKLSTLRARF